MFEYSEIAALNLSSGHISTYESLPKLREEDVSFYGLMAWASRELEDDGFINKLPGTATFEFTDKDRGIARAALKSAGVRYLDSPTRLEVCTMRLDDPARLVASDFYTLGGPSKHGLEVISHTTGVCTAQNH